MPKKIFLQSDCLSNLAILYFVFSIVVFFIDQYSAGGGGSGGNLISVAYFSFHFAGKLN